MSKTTVRLAFDCPAEIAGDLTALYETLVISTEDDTDPRDIGVLLEMRAVQAVRVIADTLNELYHWDEYHFEIAPEDADFLVRLLGLPVRDADADDEQEYRRGYCDGWIRASDTLHDLMFDRKLDRQAAYNLCFDHYEGALSEWLHGDCSQLVYPPEVAGCETPPTAPAA